MEKDTRLINIYLKIHHKRSLTISDLSYLAQYDPECFKKTCKNVVYNIPETKPIMSPDTPEFMRGGGKNPDTESAQKDERKLNSGSLQADKMMRPRLMPIRQVPSLRQICTREEEDGAHRTIV